MSRAHPSLVCVLLLACSSSTTARPPTPAEPVRRGPAPWRGEPICRAQLAPEVVTDLEARAHEGHSTCEERERLAAHYFDVQLETYDHWQPQLDEHLVWLANECPDTNQTCLLSLMVPSIAVVNAWKTQAGSHPRDAIVRGNADTVARQVNRDADEGDTPRLVESLAERADDAFDTGNMRSAEAFAIEALLRVPLTPKSPITGELVRTAHAVLGRVALRTGDTTSAQRHLIAAGKAAGASPITMPTAMWELARELVDAGQRDVVIEYLELNKAEWPHAVSMLDEWEREILDGKPSTIPRRR